jgi:hypothetical protein
MGSQWLSGGRIDPRVLIQDMVIDALSADFPVVQKLLAYAELQQCVAQYQL